MKDIIKTLTKAAKKTNRRLVISKDIDKYVQKSNLKT